MDAIEKIRRTVRCSACQGPIVDRVNLVQLDRAAYWKYPTCGNVLTGASKQSVGILCDCCIDLQAKIVEAVEITGSGRVIYHALETLAKLGETREFGP